MLAAGAAAFGWKNFKKTQTIGDILLKKGRSIEKQHRKNIIYSIPCKDCPKKYVGQPKEICRPDNRNLEKKMQRTRKLVQKEIQNKNSQIHQKEWWNRIPSPPNRTHHRLCKHKNSRGREKLLEETYHRRTWNKEIANNETSKYAIRLRDRPLLEWYPQNTANLNARADVCCYFWKLNVCENTKMKVKSRK